MRLLALLATSLALIQARLPDPVHCPIECHCDEAGVAELNVICDSGGLDDARLHSLLDRLPKATTGLRVAPSLARPNNFSITLDFARFKRLQGLSLTNSGLRSLGKRVLGTLKSLRSLQLRRNIISYLSAETFENAGHLEHLDLAHNTLGANALPTGTFSHLKHLKSLSIAQNNISQFPQNLLFGLLQLHTLVLDGNPLDAVTLSSLLSDVPNLTKLSLNGCHLKSVYRKTFAKMKSLQYLELAGNGLVGVPVAALQPLSQLRFLDLADNNIYQVPPFAFDGLPVEGIVLARNRLGACPEPDKHWSECGLHPLAFENASITQLDVSDNGYFSFQSSSLGAAQKTIKVLDVSRNPLGGLDSRLASNLSLGVLHAARIGLHSFPKRLPPELTRLDLLNVSGNPLGFIPESAARQLAASLRQLDISHCRFSRLPAYFHHLLLSGLDTVFLQENPWDCRCHILGLRDFLLRPEQAKRCRVLFLDQVRCASPPAKAGEALVRLSRPSDCAVLFGAVSGLTQESEIGILIAAVLAVLLLVGAGGLIACWTRKAGSYRTREESKVLATVANERLRTPASERLF